MKKLICRISGSQVQVCDCYIKVHSIEFNICKMFCWADCSMSATCCLWRFETCFSFMWILWLRRIEVLVLVHPLGLMYWRRVPRLQSFWAQVFFSKRLKIGTLENHFKPNPALTYPLNVRLMCVSGLTWNLTTFTSVVRSSSSILFFSNTDSDLTFADSTGLKLVFRDLKCMHTFKYLYSNSSVLQ